MTDLEMTRLCAEAMGLRVKESFDRHSSEPFAELDTGRDPGNEGAYDPLHDDEQAMALVKKFPFITTSAIRKEAQKWTSMDFNRAVVECVAHMQQRTECAK